MRSKNGHRYNNLHKTDRRFWFTIRLRSHYNGATIFRIAVDLMWTKLKSARVELSGAWPLTEHYPVNSRQKFR